MVEYDNISDNNFRLLVDSVANKLIEKLEKIGVCESENFLKAYNRFQEDEMCCADYIYDPDNNEDMVALLKDNNSFIEIAHVLGSGWYEDGEVYNYIYIDKKGRIKRMGWFGVIDFIKDYMKDIVTCAFLYRQVEEYKVLFEKEIEPLIVSL